MLAGIAKHTNQLTLTGNKWSDRNWCTGYRALTSIQLLLYTSTVYKAPCRIRQCSMHPSDKNMPQLHADEKSCLTRHTTHFTHKSATERSNPKPHTKYLCTYIFRWRKRRRVAENKQTYIIRSLSFFIIFIISRFQWGRLCRTGIKGFPFVYGRAVGVAGFSLVVGKRNQMEELPNGRRGAGAAQKRHQL